MTTVDRLFTVRNTNPTSRTDITNASIHTLGGLAVEQSVFANNLDVTTAITAPDIDTAGAAILLVGKAFEQLYFV